MEIKCPSENKEEEERRNGNFKKESKKFQLLYGYIEIKAEYR